MDEIAINSKDRLTLENIIFFKADINYTIAYYNNGKKEVIVKTLKYFEQQLKLQGFYRIHKSFLVNLRYINEKPTSFDLKIQNEYILTISRRKMPGLRRYFKIKI